MTVCQSLFVNDYWSMTICIWPFFKHHMSVTICQWLFVNDNSSITISHCNVHHDSTIPPFNREPSSFSGAFRKPSLRAKSNNFSAFSSRPWNLTGNSMNERNGQFLKMSSRNCQSFTHFCQSSQRQLFMETWRRIHARQMMSWAVKPGK